MGAISIGVHRSQLVDDFGAAIQTACRQPVSPHLEGLGCQSRPVGDLADDPECCPAAIGAGRIAGELFVGDVWIVLELPGRFDDVHPRDSVTGGEFRGEARAVQHRGEVDVVHHDFWPIVGTESGGEMTSEPQFGLCAVIERPIVQRPAHRQEGINPGTALYVGNVVGGPHHTGCLEGLIMTLGRKLSASRLVPAGVLLTTLAVACGDEPAKSPSVADSASTPTTSAPEFNGTYKVTYEAGATATWTCTPCGAGCANIAIKPETESGGLPLGAPSTTQAHLEKDKWSIAELVRKGFVCDDGAETDMDATYSWNAASLKGTFDATLHGPGCGKPDGSGTGPPESFTLVKVS